MMIVISHPDTFDNEARLINRMFENGMELFHIRKPEWDKTAVFNLINNIDPMFHNRLVLHSFYEFTGALGIKRIHGNITKIENARYGNNIIKSISCHSIDEIKNIKDKFEYIFLSPIFNSISKPDYNSPFDLEELSKILNNNFLNRIIALGGVDKTNIRTVFKTGFSGAALMGTLWQNKNEDELIENFIAINNLCKIFFPMF